MYYKGKDLNLEGYIAARHPLDDEELYDVIADYIRRAGLASDEDEATIEFYGFDILDFADIIEADDRELDDPADDEPDHERYE